jgi:hypothetical protein
MPEHMPKYCGTAIAEPPTFTGPAGSAWRVRLQPIGERAVPDWNATLDFFIVRAEGAHPFWDHWFVSVVHLRPIDGVPPAHISKPGMTHELIIAALNPELPLPSLDADHAGWKANWLTPVDVIEQFAAKDDAVAQQILELAVQAIVGGFASPDQYWRPWWANAIASTAGHFASGAHTIGRLQ